MKLPKKLNIILPLMITAALLYFLLSNVSLSSIKETAGRIPLLMLSAGLFLYIISYMIRAARFWILLDRKITLGRLFSITSLYNLVNSILPARTGELSYVYLVKKTGLVRGTEAIATLVVARLFDFLSVAVIFFISLIFVSNTPLIVRDIVPYIAAIVVIIIIMMLFMVFFSRAAERIFRRLRRYLGKMGSKPVSYLLKKAEEVLKDLGIVKSKKLLIYTQMLSLLIWLSNYLMCYLLVIGMGIKTSIWAVLIVFSVLMFVGVMPISIAGFGTIEGTWAIMFISFGVGKELAISSGFGLHIALIIYMLILGAYGFVALKLMKKEQ